ncbi:MAG: cytochrome c-type biogenesis protein CcmH [Candidatus Binatia bacterium]
MWRTLLVLILLLTPSPALLAQPPDLEEQAQQIGAVLRCPVCQNLSVADSPSELAQEMRAVIRKQLKEGKEPDQVKAYFVSKYGDWVLLAPPRRGFNLLVWVLPFFALAVGFLIAVLLLRRSVRKTDKHQPKTVDPALIDRVRREAAEKENISSDLQAQSLPPPLQLERNRLYANLRELEFDYQTGKLSEADYRESRQSLEAQAAMVLREIDLSASPHPIARTATTESKQGQATKQTLEKGKVSQRGWRLAAGGIFLLVFGVTIGVLLTRSLRPRLSQQDSVTGDFLTGTDAGGLRGKPGTGGVASKDLPNLLSQGRAAFERHDLRAAITTFKRALEIDPNQPEAHTYMGLILTQAGHSDGALLAFNRALLTTPNYPLALLGKGLVLYHAKKDYVGAREALNRLVNLLPAGAQKEEIQNTIAELNKLVAGKKTGSQPAQVPLPTAGIRGTVSLDPKLKPNMLGRGVLFIIARSSDSAGGPPLAVKKINQPVFPSVYSLSSKDIIMPGQSFPAKVRVSALLDKDGNAMTKEPGNLRGEAKDNPVKIGSHNVDIVITRQ